MASVVQSIQIKRFNSQRYYGRDSSLNIDASVSDPYYSIDTNNGCKYNLCHKSKREEKCGDGIQYNVIYTLQRKHLMVVVVVT